MFFPELSSCTLAELTYILFGSGTIVLSCILTAPWSHGLWLGFLALTTMPKNKKMNNNFTNTHSFTVIVTDTVVWVGSNVLAWAHLCLSRDLHCDSRALAFIPLTLSVITYFSQILQLQSICHPKVDITLVSLVISCKGFV